MPHSGIQAQPQMCTPYFINPQHMNWVRCRFVFDEWRKPLTSFPGVLSANISGLEPTLRAGVFVSFFIPEMKGGSLEETEEMVIQKVSVKNLPKHHSTLLDTAASEVQQKNNTKMFTKAKVEHVEANEAKNLERAGERKPMSRSSSGQ